jgi:hypothetical protein
VVLTRILTQFKFELDPNYVLAYHLVSLYSPVCPMKYSIVNDIRFLKEWTCVSS